MKRRDLIWNLSYINHNDLIKNIAEFNSQGNWSSAHRHYRLLIDRIIEAAEKEGMLPPAAMVHDSPYPEGHKYYGPHKTLQNKWEPEDETK